MYAMAEGKVEEFVSRYKTMLKHPVQSPKIKFAIEFIDDFLNEEDRSDNMKRLLGGAKIILQAYMLSDKKWQRLKNAYVKAIASNEELKILAKLLSSIESNRTYLKNHMLLDAKAKNTNS